VVANLAWIPASNQRYVDEIMCPVQKSASQVSSVRDRALPMWLAMVKQRKENLPGKKLWLLLAMVTPLQLRHAREIKRQLVDALGPPWCELAGFSSPVLVRSRQRRSGFYPSDSRRHLGLPLHVCFLIGDVLVDRFPFGRVECRGL